MSLSSAAKKLQGEEVSAPLGSVCKKRREGDADETVCLYAGATPKTSNELSVVDVDVELVHDDSDRMALVKRTLEQRQGQFGSYVGGWVISLGQDLEATPGGPSYTAWIENGKETTVSKPAGIGKGTSYVATKTRVNAIDRSGWRLEEQFVKEEWHIDNGGLIPVFIQINASEKIRLELKR
jgi:hypothetical protein